MSALLPRGTSQAVLKRIAPGPARQTPDPVDWVQSRLGEFLWSAQRTILGSLKEHRKTAVQSAHGIGKALDLETLLPTPTGWTTMGDVQVGDQVLDERGLPCLVTSVAGWEDRPRYRVRFSDGTEVIADAEHEWSITRFQARNLARKHAYDRGAPIRDWREVHPALANIVTTRALRSMTRTSWGQSDAAVPVTVPLDLPERDLLVDPYVLGVFLADGTRQNGSITVARSEGAWIEPRLGGHRVPSQSRASTFSVRIPGLAVKLRGLGALDPKRIPASYMRASFGQRLALLQGIMDGDGFLNGAAAGIDLTHELLALDVIELMRTLGLQPRVKTSPAVVSGRIVGIRWRINVTQTVPCFSLPSKLSERPVAQACRATHRMVVAVEPVEPGPTRCVEVDSPSHLFLAGQGMVPTHNSYVASRAAAWWIAAHPPGEAMVVSSAPSAHQVRAILWGELSKAHAKGGLSGHITRGQVPEWVIDGQVVAFGRKPPDAIDETEARTQFQGIHARYLLVVLDEACGVPKWLWDAAGTLATNESSRILAIGNPDDPASHFAKVCAPGQGYNVIQVSVFDTPNFTGERVPPLLSDSLVGPTYVQDAARDWGVESPMYTSKVLGVFPEVSDDVCITPRMVREAHERDLSGRMISDRGRYGMDVARHGEDESCVYLNRGGVIRLVDAWRVPDLTVSTDKARAMLLEDVARVMTVDAVGLGYGVFDPLRREGRKVLPFQGGERANDPARFVDKNAEAWWGFRESLEAGLIDLDPEDELLAAQLQSRRWGLDASQRRIKLESKDDMAKRGVKSPDRADACILSYYRGVHVPDAGVVLDRGPFDGPDSICGDLLAMRT